MHNNVYWLLPLWNRHFFVIAKFILKMHNLQFWWGYVDPLWETVIQAAIRVGHAGSWFNQKLQQKIEKKYMCINGICCRADTQTENHVYVQTSIIAVCRLQILSERAVYETLDPRIILHYAHTHKSRWKPQAPLSIDVRACAFMHAKWTHPILLVRAQRTEWMGSRVMHHSTAHTGPSWHGTAPDIEIRFTVIPVRERAGDNMHMKIYRYCSFSNSLSLSLSLECRSQACWPEWASVSFYLCFFLRYFTPSLQRVDCSANCRQHTFAMNRWRKELALLCLHACICTILCDPPNCYWTLK